MFGHGAAVTHAGGDAKLHSVKHARLTTAFVIALGACGPSYRLSPTVQGLGVASDPAAPLARPALRPPADTNDARAYYDRAVSLIGTGTSLDTADMALYWASRLDPDWANPLYARAIVILRALHTDQLRELFRYRSSRVLSLTPRQAGLVDSLVRLAWAHNPLLFTNVDLFILPSSPPGGHPDPGLEGWRSYKLGYFARAESLLAMALRGDPDQIELRVYRAQSLALLGRFDSAAAEFGAARDMVRARAVSHASPVLPSLEMFEYAIGMVRVNQGDFPSAKEAFGRALTENLAFYWAHARLAGVDLALGDTAAALTELGLAVELEEDDPALRLYHGYVLRVARHYVDAAAELRRSIQLEPYYAQPHVQLALLARAEGNQAAAVDHYRRFLELAARRDPDRAAVVRALSALATPPDSR